MISILWENWILPQKDYSYFEKVFLEEITISLPESTDKQYMDHTAESAKKLNMDNWSESDKHHT